MNVAFTPLNLGPDEAQYWRWSTAFDWGYYSKPPMIAWAIGLTTSLFGDAEWAIRISSPVFHMLTGVFVYATGARLWSVRAGVYAGLTYLLMPGVWLSSLLMTTDVLLLFFWSAGLYLFARFRSTPNVLLGGALGLVIALGFLSKYAMIYFLIGTAIAFVFDKPTRSAFLSLAGGLVVLAFGLAMLPHILWSQANGFETIGHTADNANWSSGEMFHPAHFPEFITDQMGVFGPVTFVLLITFAVIWALQKTVLKSDSSVRVLLGFCLPPILIIMVQAVLSRAHANWAASAYPAGALLLGAWAHAATTRVRPALIAGLGLNLFVGLTFAVLAMSPPQLINSLGAANAVKRLRGWPETIEALKQAADEIDATAIIVDEREIWHGLDYYGRDGVVIRPVLAWRRNVSPASFSEEEPISPEAGANALVVSYHKEDREKLAADFENFTPEGQIEIDLGGGRYRRLDIFRGQGFAPLPKD